MVSRSLLLLATEDHVFCIELIFGICWETWFLVAIVSLTNVWSWSCKHCKALGKGASTLTIFLTSLLKVIYFSVSSPCKCTLQAGRNCCWNVIVENTGARSFSVGSVARNLRGWYLFESGVAVCLVSNSHFLFEVACYNVTSDQLTYTTVDRHKEMRTSLETKKIHLYYTVNTGIVVILF